MKLFNYSIVNRVPDPDPDPPKPPPTTEEDD